MSDETIFNETTPVIEEVKPVINSAPTLPDGLQELVGEGKKYKSVEDALAAVPHAQSHIQKLELELKENREALSKVRSTEEVYETVKELLKAEGRQPEGGLDEAAIAAVFDRKLVETKQRDLEAANVNTVKIALNKKFGDKAEEVYKQRATELGVGTGFLNDLVRRSPSAAFELLGIKPASSTPGATLPGSINTESLKPNPDNSPRKSVMYGASTAEMVAAFRASKGE